MNLVDIIGGDDESADRKPGMVYYELYDGRIYLKPLHINFSEKFGFIDFRNDIQYVWIINHNDEVYRAKVSGSIVGLDYRLMMKSEELKKFFWIVLNAKDR